MAKNRQFLLLMKKWIDTFFQGAFKKREIYRPSYRVVEILQDDDDEYVAVIQLISRSLVFKIKPEEILSKDKFVDCFSPKDIRTLTYLGYLGINSPKYKVLAKHLSDENDNLLFALKKKGKKKVVIKTADQIAKEQDILGSMDAHDAQLVGYTLASENVRKEQEQKKKLRKQIAEKKALDTEST